MNPNMGMATTAYRQAAASVHPSVAVVKVYDEAILAIVNAVRAKECNEHERAFSTVLRAAMILRGLSHSLDFTKGGAVAERLFAVYRSYILQLHLSYGKDDAVHRYRTLLGGLIDLRNAWATIAGMPEREVDQVLKLSHASAPPSGADRALEAGREARQNALLAPRRGPGRIGGAEGVQLRRRAAGEPGIAEAPGFGPRPKPVGQERALRRDRLPVIDRTVRPRPGTPT